MRGREKVRVRMRVTDRQRNENLKGTEGYEHTRELGEEGGKEEAKNTTPINQIFPSPPHIDYVGATVGNEKTKRRGKGSRREGVKMRVRRERGGKEGGVRVSVAREKEGGREGRKDKKREWGGEREGERGGGKGKDREGKEGER